MFCEQCGALVPDGMKFCDQCGAPVADGENTPIMNGTEQNNIQPEPVNYVPPMQQGMPGINNRPKKSPLVPLVIAAVAVIILGPGGFLAYKNIDKLKGLVGKVKDSGEQSEEDLIENGDPDEDGAGNESIEENLEEVIPESKDSDKVKPADNTKEEDNAKEDIKDDITQESNTKEDEADEDITEKDKAKEERSDDKENRPDIGDVRDYDTSREPVWSDFEWVMSDEMTQGLLSGEDMFSDSAYRLTDFDDVVGGWNGYLCYDPNNTYADNPWGGPMVFLVHAEISGDRSEPSLYFEWLQYRKTADGEEGKLTSKETFACNRRSNNVFNGRAGSGWHITLEHFCWIDGKEYATGRMKAADGGDCILALFRP